MNNVLVIHLLVIGLSVQATKFDRIEEFSEETFRDDFNGNASNWIPTNRNNQINGELQNYSPDNVAVEQGVLNLKATHVNNSYFSGRVQGKFDILYGEIEWKARIPKGQGLWSTLGLIPTCSAAVSCEDKWPLGISMMDVRGHNPNEIVMSVFSNNATQQPSATSKYLSKVNTSEGYHIYRLYWSKQKLIWYVDNETGNFPVFSVDDEKMIPSVPMQIVMNVAIGGEFPGTPNDDTAFPTAFSIEYVVVRGQGKPSLGILLGTLVPTVCLLLLGFGVFVLIRKRRRINQGNMRNQLQTTSLTYASSPSEHLENSHPMMIIDSSVQEYVSLLEIPMANLQISNDVLGKGEYGVVTKGVAQGLRGQASSTVVAVKTVKNTSTSEDRHQFIQEMKMMIKAGRHLNIVNLLGAVIKGDTLLLLEYCPFGNLLKYLKTHRNGYIYNHVDSTDGSLLPFDEKEQERLEKLVSTSNPQRSFPEDNFDNQMLATADLISFSYQISRGMAYLGSRSIIHRDLAARNVLVCDSQVIKIADFGMARQEPSEYVIQARSVALPLKWMAPESIQRGIFTHKTDVWSFGVVMWEIFSIGETPYSSSESCSYLIDFIAALNNGFQMQRSTGCPIQLYELMKQCWKLNPSERPKFSQLEIDLQNIISPGSQDLYLKLDMPYQQYNLAHQDFLDEIRDPVPNDGLDL